MSMTEILEDAAAGGEPTPAPEGFYPKVVAQELYDKVKSEYEAAQASFAKAVEDRDEAQIEAKSLRSRIAELEGMLAAGAAKAEAEAETVFETAEDEAAALKKRLVAMIEEAKSLSSRLADIVVHPAVHPAMAFHSAVSSLKVLFGELL